ncbi:MAG: DUF721 domain-containing protein [Spirochaetales bacterium]|nr:DUF721 domain-containing protein [Spirochaetales bacterium]
MKAENERPEKRIRPPRRKDSYERLEPEDPISGSVFFDQVLDRFDIDLADPANQILIHWKDIVDVSISEHSRPQKLKDGVLYIVCDHPSRASYIRLNSTEIVKSIKGVYPEVDLKKIVTRIRY